MLQELAPCVAALLGTLVVAPHGRRAALQVVMAGRPRVQALAALRGVVCKAVTAVGTGVFGDDASGQDAKTKALKDSIVREAPVSCTSACELRSALHLPVLDHV